MTDINNIIVDDYTKHSVNLMRVEEGFARSARKYLKRLEKELVTQLKLIDPTDIESETYKIRRLNKLLEQTRETIKSSYKGFKGEVVTELTKLSSLESDFTVGSLDSALKVETLTTGLTRQAMRDIVRTSLVQGTTVSDWMGRLAKNTQTRLQDSLKMGMLAGESMGDLVRRIRGRAIPGSPGKYFGGVMATTTREAESFARTAAQTISNITRDNVLKDNRDLLKGRQLLVTLDNRTSTICIGRSGMAWDFEGKPLSGTNTTISYPGAPPYHWQCRSTLIPLLKSLAELGAKVKNKLPESTQASMGGQVSGKLTYEDWLKKQPVEIQRDVLGASRYKLWKEKKIKSFRELLDQSGQPLSVAELKFKYLDEVQLGRLEIPDDATLKVGDYYKAKGFNTVEELEEYAAGLKVGWEGQQPPKAWFHQGVHDWGNYLKSTPMKKDFTLTYRLHDADGYDVGKKVFALKAKPRFKITNITKETTFDGRVKYFVDLDQIRDGVKPVIKKVTTKTIEKVFNNPKMDELLEKAGVDKKRLKSNIEILKSGLINGKTIDTTEMNRVVKNVTDDFEYLSEYLIKGRYDKEALARIDKLTDSVFIGLKSKVYRNRVKRSLHDAIAITGKLPSSLRRVVKTRDRAYALKFSQTINIGSSVAHAQSCRTTLLHEFGHHVEYTNKSLNSKAKKIIKTRAKGQEKLSKLTGLNYSPKEVAFFDDFIDAYVGKIYENGYTEVVSIGLEHFSNGSTMFKLFEKDEEHFNLILDLVF